VLGRSISGELVAFHPPPIQTKVTFAHQSPSDPILSHSNPTRNGR